MSRKTVLRIVVLAAVAAGVAWVIVNREALDVTALEAWVLGFGVWAPVVFVALYAAAAPLGAPGSALTLAGGVLFGPVWGSVYSLVGATAGASLAFLIARYVAAEWVAARAKGILARVIAGIEARGLAVRGVRAPGAAVPVQSVELMRWARRGSSSRTM